MKSWSKGLKGHLGLLFLSYAQDDTKRKVLIINSYHRGYKRADEITEGIESVLKAGSENVRL
jgi:hypothetical protein